MKLLEPPSWFKLTIALLLVTVAGCGLFGLEDDDEESIGPLNNPLKGWAPYWDHTTQQPHSMVFTYISWRELEPEKGDFRFEAWENRTWSKAVNAGKRIIFRVYCDYPTLPIGVPQWLLDEGVSLSDYSDHGGGKSPDYEHTAFKDNIVRLIETMGQRYNSDERVAFIQVGILGHWGEWHTYPRNELFASAEVQTLVIDALHTAFPDKHLQARYPGGVTGTQDWLGYHDDMFPEDTDSGPDWHFMPVMRTAGQDQNWKVAPIGGEMVPNAASKWMLDEFNVTWQAAETAHFTWVGPYCPAMATSGNDNFLKNSRKLVRRMGYQFEIDLVEHVFTFHSGSSQNLGIFGSNTGLAPFYYPWVLEASLTDKNGNVTFKQATSVDIRTWLPGDFESTFSLNLPTDLAAGTYKLGIAILDPATSEPAVELVADAEEKGKRYLFGDIKVE
ncbi:DUF4832 domain-containing protein [candidate division KSB1 bacterium]